MRKLFSLIRKFIAFLLSLFSLTGFFAIYANFTSTPPNYPSAFIISIVMLLLFTAAFFIYPKKETITQAEPDDTIHTSLDDYTDSSYSIPQDYLTENSKQFLKEYSSVEAVITKMDSDSVSILTNASEDKKDFTSTFSSINTVTSNPIKKKPYFTSSVHTYVTGIKYENRNAVLKRYINKLKKDGLIFETYQGLRGKELKESLEYDDIIWEIETEISSLKLVEEPENKHDSKAIAVYIEYPNKKIGYIPKTDLKIVKDIIDNYDFHASGFINGGKYKKLDWDNKIEISEKNYSVEIELHYRS